MIPENFLYENGEQLIDYIGNNCYIIGYCFSQKIYHVIFKNKVNNTIGSHLTKFNSFYINTMALDKNGNFSLKELEEKMSSLDFPEDFFYYIKFNKESQKEIKDYPHKCPLCGSPAYVSCFSNKIDCSKCCLS